MFRYKFVAVLGLALALSRPAIAFVRFTKSFSSNPFSLGSNWSFGIGDNSNTQFVWNASAPAYTGDPTGELDVHLNSSLPTARFQRPLGVTLTDSNDFTVTTRFSFHLISNPNDQAIQIAFGLVNHALTGGDRTGTADSSGNFLPTDNTFDTVEFDYFPSISVMYDSGPTLTPVAIGAQAATNDDMFANFASIFGSGSNLGDNTIGVTALPQDVTLQATLAYTATNQTITLTMSRVNSDGSLTPINTEVPPMNLVDDGYNTNFPFVVDTLAIMAYHDGFTTTNAPSLVADLKFQELDFTAAVNPPPPSYVAIHVVGSNVVLTFPTISNNLYQVQSATDLVSHAWSTIASNIPGTDGVVTNMDMGGANVSRRFYRVGLQQN